MWQMLMQRTDRVFQCLPTACSGPQRVREQVALAQSVVPWQEKLDYWSFCCGWDAEVCSIPAVSFGCLMKHAVPCEDVLLCSIL